MLAVAHNGVEIDACEPCRLIWFDPKERRATTRPPRSAAPDPDLVEWHRQQTPEPAETPRRSGGAGDVVEGILLLLEGLLLLP